MPTTQSRSVENSVAEHSCVFEYNIFWKKNACVQKTAGPTEILRAPANRLGTKQVQFSYQSILTGNVLFCDKCVLLLELAPCLNF